MDEPTDQERKAFRPFLPPRLWFEGAASARGHFEYFPVDAGGPQGWSQRWLLR